MKLLRHADGKLSFFLILAIIVLCAGFLIISCGKKPQQKTKNANKGAYAIDFSLCPSGTTCSATPKGSSVTPIPDISGREVTIEAWVKTSASTTSGTIFQRSDGDKGVVLSVENNVPKFIVRRFPITGDIPLAQQTALSECVKVRATSTECTVPAITQSGTTTTGVAATFTIPTSTPTSTLTISSPIYVNSASIVSSFIDATGDIITLIGETAHSIIVPAQTVDVSPATATTFNVTNVTAMKVFPKNLVQESWTHIAGVITGADQSNGPSNCAVDTDGNGKLQGIENPHLAIFINGSLINCASTGGDGVYAENPSTEEAVIGFLGGAVIDELRLWGSGRTETEINNCMNTELGISGQCDRGNAQLAAYFRFNEGQGADITDFSGNGFSGGFEIIDGTGLFPPWEDGWVTGAPITPAD